MVKILPKKWVAARNAYSSNTQKIQAESDWKKVLKSYSRLVITNGIILLALMLISFNFLMPFLARSIEDGFIRNLVGLVISLAVATPFLWALMAHRPDYINSKELWTKRI